MSIVITQREYQELRAIKKQLTQEQEQRKQLLKEINKLAQHALDICAKISNKVVLSVHTDTDRPDPPQGGQNGGSNEKTKR